VRRAVVVAVLVCLFVAGCSSGAGQRQKVTVFAATSLSDAFTAMAGPFAAADNRYSLTFSFAGSQQVAAQIAQGARADALATADRASMTSVDRFAARTPSVFAGNRLVIAVRPGNPKGIAGLSDLSRSDLSVVLAAPDVPAGKYARQALGATGVTVHPVSLEENVGAVVTKVALGEADAGVVYATDTRVPGRGVQAVPIPDKDNVRAEYFVVPLTGSPAPAGASAFVSFVLSAKGQAVLRRLGFLPR
jgi:molybdate transport system substrate-binding protein